MRAYLKLGARSVFAAAVLLAAVVCTPSQLRAQCGSGAQTFDCNPPAGAIFDLVASEPTNTVLSTLTTFSTSFVGDGSTEYVSFAFRESPAYFIFDDPSVTAQGSSTNLLADTNFASSTIGQNCNHDNSLGCPAGWGAWIQSVDITAIGQVASTSASGGCASEVTGVSGNFWCDGSVEGYDAIYQAIATTAGTTYNVSWLLNDDSFQDLTESTLTDQIDMLVYTGDAIPANTSSIGMPPAPPSPPSGGTTTPEPSTLILVGVGLAVLLFASRKRAAELS